MIRPIDGSKFCRSFQRAVSPCQAVLHQDVVNGYLLVLSAVLLLKLVLQCDTAAAS